MKKIQKQLEKEKIRVEERKKEKAEAKAKRKLEREEAAKISKFQKFGLKAFFELTVQFHPRPSIFTSKGYNVSIQSYSMYRCQPR